MQLGSQLVAVVCLTALLLAAASGCQSITPTVDIWVGNEDAGIRPWTEVAPVTQQVRWGESRVELHAAINETVSFQFVVRPQNAGIKAAELRVIPIAAPSDWVDSDSVRVFRMHHANVGRWPGWHLRAVPPDQREASPLDVLVPVDAPQGGLPGQLELGEDYHFWVDLSVPNETGPGAYSIGLEITAEDRVVASLVAELTVWPFALPDDVGIPVIAELDHRALFEHHFHSRGRPHGLSTDNWQDDPLADELDVLLAVTLRELHDHGLDPVLPYLSPLVKVDTRADLQADWTQYDAVAEQCLNGKAFANGEPAKVWPLPVSRAFQANDAGTSPSASIEPALVSSYLKRCAEHFAERGWLERSYAFVPIAASDAVTGFQRVHHMMETIRRADPRIPILLPLFPHDLEPYGWNGYRKPLLSDRPDIWMPPAQFFDRDSMAAERAAGRRTWLTLDRPPFSGTTVVAAPPSYTRAIARQAVALGAEAVSLGGVNPWPPAGSSPTPSDCVAADPAVLLYPGRLFGMDKPVPSVRLKRLRRGMQDLAYDYLLAQHGLSDLVDTLVAPLVPCGASGAYRAHYADGNLSCLPGDSAMSEAARQIMARELIAAAFGSKPETRAEVLTRAAVRRRFALLAERLLASVEGIRVRQIGSPAQPITEVECAVRVDNHTPLPISGIVQFGELPEGWTVEPGGQRFQEIPAKSGRVVRLRAETSDVPVGQSGYVNLPFELASDDGRVRRFEGRLSCITAEWAETPIRVDGDLSDWPLGSSNIATDFALITGHRGNQVGVNHSSPRSRTLGFVMRDREYLYIGVNCETGTGVAIPASRSKSVEYDDLIPVGDELIEVLIDPYNLGTRSPADLYHVVVKMTGSDLAERGIRFDPPCGERTPWLVDIEVGTRVDADRWTAEIRIPLAAFGGSGSEQAIWGFNITRFDLAHQEFSTWSGAIGNAYDPLALGNLHLP